ncbi:hypothetical protein BVG16_22600 [Paenibacillus selenitireducens]|uniref:Uncharacterized protein n=1 Tax=Paenibacillus selenitireducens TaxID=1324314 RepID=A0A1T2X4R6_9BACL|nr:hypothetical protein [Paenibacillus selenitireducens]OPA74563.1 hypothetical protein BVG16_22600 [Paenibacillus selenitireducens]
MNTDSWQEVRGLSGGHHFLLKEGFTGWEYEGLHWGITWTVEKVYVEDVLYSGSRNFLSLLI